MHHSGQQNEPKATGSDMCLAENRDIENFSNLNHSEIANHVWESCKPAGSFMLKSPTVSARRVQLMRVYLQSYVPDAEPEPSEPCKKSSKPIPRPPAMCPCGNPMRKDDSKMNSMPTSSLSDVMYSGPEDKDDDCCEEDEDDECYNYE